MLLPDDIVRASLLGHVRRVVMNSAGVVIEMGRKQRLFTGAARDAAKLMATTCDHPGCGVSVTFAQVDHMVEWSDNGVTDPENSSIACGRHNPTKHTHYRVRRTDRGYVVYHRRDGTPDVGSRPTSPRRTARDRRPDDCPPRPGARGRAPNRELISDGTSSASASRPLHTGIVRSGGRGRAPARRGLHSRPSQGGRTFCMSSVYTYPKGIKASETSHRP